MSDRRPRERMSLEEATVGVEREHSKDQVRRGRDYQRRENDPILLLSENAVRVRPLYTYDLASPSDPVRHAVA